MVMRRSSSDPHGSRVTTRRVCAALCVLTLASGWLGALAKERAPALPRTRGSMAEDISAAEDRAATREAVLESLKRRDWATALTQAATLIPQSANDADDSRPYGYERDLSKNNRWREDLQQLEATRDLFERIRKEMPQATDALSARLSAAFIQLDWELARLLDPPRARSLFGWDTALAGIDWWWDGVPEAREYIASDERYSRWHWRVGMALQRDGQPIFLDPPADYTSDLPRAKKLLFVLDEIERLDTSPQRHAAAEALLARARLMRRLYGPQTDVDWTSAEFYYRFDKRPSFLPGNAAAGVKEMWELADDEARTNVHEESRVIELPKSHSPLALLARLERDYPQSASVPYAVHERGLYYQSRRQFAQAIEAYRRELQQFPQHPLAERAKAQIARIEQADVLLGRTGIYSAGISPKLWFACRNAEIVEFTARPFDLERWMDDSKREDLRDLRNGLSGFGRFGEGLEIQELARLNKYAGAETAKWTEPVGRSERVASYSTAAPLIQPGAYLVNARVPGSDRSSTGLVVVSGIAILQKPLEDRVLIWVVDPRTGEPIPGQDVQIVTWNWSRRRRDKDETITKTSDQQGIIEYSSDSADDVHVDGYVFVEAPGRGAAFCELARPADGDNERPRTVATALTDRPAYRPGSTVSFRIWVRDVLARRCLPVEAGRAVHITVRNAHYDTVRAFSLATDAAGSVTGAFTLGRETPLGEYRFLAQITGRKGDAAAGGFRVEEYKTPEFAVTVSPAKAIARPGETIAARVAARYYFGTPVADAEVRYCVFRQQQQLDHVIPGEFDWLYGAGYGNPESEFRVDNDDTFGTRLRSWWSWRSAGRRERVAEGSARLDADGQMEIQIEPGELPGDPTHVARYDIEVEVRDESRRTVEGNGVVLAARQEFFSFAQTDRGWYAPGDPVVIGLQARSINDVPVAATGQAVLSRLGTASGVSPTADEILEKWDMALDAQGNQTLKFAAPAPGRYQIEVRTRDSAGSEISTTAAFWVYSIGADLTRSPLPPLQIIADRQTYRTGETARLLVLTAAADALVLVSGSPQDYRFLQVSNHAHILEVPIDDLTILDKVIEGTMVWDGSVHTARRRLFVPPVHELLNVELLADKSVYRPGERGKLRVQVTDREGRPVSGDLALTAFDKSLTYIQTESTIGPRSFLTARISHRWRWAEKLLATLNPRLFDTSGSFMCPEFYLSDDYVPQIGGMGGQAPTGGDPGDTGGQADATPDPIAMVLAAAVPQLRSDFSDTALWQPHLAVDANGVAETEITFPESLTTWRFCGYLVTADTRVGDLTHDLPTSKNLLVRLQRPRFLVERDEVVLSANVHNNLDREKTVTAELYVPAAQFRVTDNVQPDADGNLRLTAQAQVPSGGRHRFDWTLSVVSEGLAAVVVKALTDEESDAVKTTIPIRVYGTAATLAQTSGFIRGEPGKKTLMFELPEDIDRRKTHVAVAVASTPASAAFEALPYLAGYPYGCVEQTMSRFYPTVLAAKTLRDLGIDVAQLAARSQTGHPRGGLAPGAILDQSELDRMIEAGLQRLTRFQHDDGGWGWWEHDASSPYMTAYVLIGLRIAAESGAQVDAFQFDRGLRYLMNTDQHARLPDIASRAADARHTELMAAYALSLSRPASFPPQESRDRNTIDNMLMVRLHSAFVDRHQLTVYDRLLLAMSLHNRNEQEKAATVLQELLESVEEDKEQETAHVSVSAPQYWHAWNSEIETNAWLLRTIVAVDRDHPLAPQLVNWLALHRTQGRFWRNTRETAIAVTAMAEYLTTVPAGDAERHVVLRIDDGPETTVALARTDVLGVETALEQPLAPGRHQLTVERQGTEPLSIALHGEFVRTTTPSVAEGNGIAISRKYFLRRFANAPTDSAAAQGTTGAEPQPVEMDDAIAVGDVLDVELTIVADDDYEYVAFEDLKPAGCEPVRVQSGSTYGDDLWANVELRDELVAFFATYLHRGTHVLRYQLRAETPGRFHALPARGFAMYAPEIHGRSSEFTLQIQDRK